MKVKFVVVACCFVILVNGKSIAQNKNDLECRIDNTKASAYLTFEKAEKINSSVSGESAERVWLKFHNNSKWNMSVATIGTEKIYGDYQVFYGLKATDEFRGEIPEVPKSHIFITRIIGSCETFVFSFPKKNLIEGLILYLEFSYEWEIGGNSGGGSGFIRHLVEFPYYNLPRDLKKEEGS